MLTKAELQTVDAGIDSSWQELIEGQSACIDWLTITVKDLGRQELIFNEAQRLFTLLKDQGNVQRPWSFKGYVGFSCAGARWGAREGDSILMLSGAAAQLNWPIALAWCDNCSRIDLAVTVNLVEPNKDVAWDAWQVICGPKLQDDGFTRKFTFVRNNEGGQTLYVGSRASEQFGRLYDKGREDSSLDLPSGKMWRYEVEFKSYRAKKIAGQLLESAKREESPVSSDIGATVYKWFLSRGVQPIIKPYDEGGEFSVEISARISDDDTSLRWLSTQVSPTVKRLIANGKGKEVLRSLGLVGD